MSRPKPDPDLDPFAVLGVPVLPWLDPDLVQARFDELSRRAHPDAAEAANGRSPADFARLREAYETLRDPVRRVRALLAHYGEAPAARTGVVDEHLVERFMELGAFLAETDALVERRNATSSSLARALLAPGLNEAQRKVAVFLDGIEEELAAQDDVLEQVTAHMPEEGDARPAPPLFSTLRTVLQTTAFLRKWQAELKQRQFSLENA
jgi:curved DNA-binding protein CbpA